MRTSISSSPSSPFARLLSIAILLLLLPQPSTGLRKYLRPRQSSGGDLVPCSEQDMSGLVCCSDGYTTCPDTDTCGTADNGVLGCCPIGESCSGDATIDTDTIFSDESTALGGGATSDLFGDSGDTTSDDFSFPTSSSDDFSFPTTTGGGGGFFDSSSSSSDDFSFPTITTSPRGATSLPPLPSITSPSLPTFGPPPRQPGQAGARPESLSFLQLGVLAAVQVIAGIFV